jgi:hypothetical protein
MLQKGVSMTNSTLSKGLTNILNKHAFDLFDILFCTAKKYDCCGLCPDNYRCKDYEPELLFPSARSGPCDSCKYYSTRFMPEENHTENYCDFDGNCNFWEVQNCCNYQPASAEQMGAEEDFEEFKRLYQVGPGEYRWKPSTEDFMYELLTEGESEDGFLPFPVTSYCRDLSQWSCEECTWKYVCYPELEPKDLPF